MARYVLPVFNVPCNIWRAASPPPGPPALSVLANLSPGKIVNSPDIGIPAGLASPGAMWLRLPRATDIRDGKSGLSPDIVEVPAGSGRMYVSIWVDDIGGGFPNEHRFAVLAAGSVWPVPFPPVGGPPGPPPPVGFSNEATFATVTLLGLSGGVIQPGLVNPLDRGYMAMARFNPVNPVTVTHGGIAATLLATQLVPLFGGVSAELTLWEGQVGTPGGRVWFVNHLLFPGCPMIYKAISIDTTPPATVGIASNAGFAVSPASQALAGGEVLFATTPSLVLSLQFGLGAMRPLILPPFQEFSLAVQSPPMLTPCWLAFGGVANPPVAPLTGVVAFGPGIESFAIAVGGKH